MSIAQRGDYATPLEHIKIGEQLDSRHCPAHTTTPTSILPQMPEYTKSSFNKHGLRACDPAGALLELSNTLHLSQAVIIPAGLSLVTTSGQCGFKEDGSMPSNKREQVLQAFANADKVLREAGCQDGWKNVYQWILFYPALDEEFIEALKEAEAKYLGDNRPAQTGVQVAGLYGGAIIEINLHAYIPQ
jgi:enamine deaminase RidA (YjgF/YER057c/UK114 family)